MSSPAKKKITDLDSLLAEQARLRALSKEQEAMLAGSAEELRKKLTIGALAKQLLSGLASSPSTKRQVLKFIAGTGLSLLLAKMTGGAGRVVPIVGSSLLSGLLTKILGGLGKKN